MARLDEKVKTLFAVASCILLIACLLFLPAYAADNDQGVLEIQLKDHREAIDDFAKLDITVDKILVSPKPGLMFWQTGWKELTPSTATIDLTQYVGKKSARIFRGTINTGSFDAFHIKIKSSEAVLKKTRRPVQVKNTLGPMKIAFQVPAKGETLLVLDLVVTDFSDHPPRGYELGIRGYEVYTNGQLVEKIPPG
jgi:Domain of unknown function (DUF4382)